MWLASHLVLLRPYLAIAAIVASRGWTVLGQALLVAGALSGIVAAVFHSRIRRRPSCFPFDWRGRLSRSGWSRGAAGDGLRVGSGRIRLRPRLTVESGDGRLAFRRRLSRSARLAFSACRTGQPSRRLGSDEPWRGRDDPVGTSRSVAGANRPLHACASRSRGGRSPARCGSAGTLGLFARLHAVCRARSVSPPPCRSVSASSSLPVSAQSWAFCRSTNGSPAPTARERRFGGNPLWGRFECRLLRIGAQSDGVASCCP